MTREGEASGGLTAAIGIPAISDISASQESEQELDEPLELGEHPRCSGHFGFYVRQHFGSVHFPIQQSPASEGGNSTF